MKTFEFLGKGEALMNDKKVMDFVNKVVTERIKPGTRYMIKDIKKIWERTNGVGMNGLGVSFDVLFDCKSFVMIFTYECESFNIDGKAEDIAFYLIDKKVLLNALMMIGKFIFKSSKKVIDNHRDFCYLYLNETTKRR